MPHAARSLPISAEARGQLRLFKQQLRRRYATIDRLIGNAGVADDTVVNFVAKSGIGRRRAFERIRKAIAPSGAVLEMLDLDGPNPIAVWAVLNSRDAVTVDSPDPSDAQNCICLNYVVAGLLRPNVRGLADGLWSLELTDHALGRLLQRAPATDLAAAIFEAHHAALRLRHRDVADDQGHALLERDLLLPAGPGGFLCEVSLGCDVSAGELDLHLICRTWVDDDQLRADQVKCIDDGGPGERLVDSWFLPFPLRRVRPWRGLPPSPSRPAGRA